MEIKTISWSFTNKCNLNCLHCIVDAGKEYHDELSTIESKNVVDQLSQLNCNCIHFTGGECLTKPNFLDVAEYCLKKDINTTLVTNATLLDDTNVDIIKNIFNDVRVSLNGASEKTHDFIRGKGNFNKTLKVIDLLNNAGVPVIFFVTLGSINYSEITDIIKLSRVYKAAGLKIDSVVIEGRALGYQEIFSLDAQQTQSLVDEFNNGLSGILEEDDLCNISSQSLYLSPAGDVYPCVHLSLNKSKRYFLGNVREMTILQMIQKFNREILPDCKNKKCIYKFYSKGSNYILGTKNPNNSRCLS